MPMGGGLGDEPTGDLALANGLSKRSSDPLLYFEELRSMTGQQRLRSVSTGPPAHAVMRIPVIDA